MVSARLLESVLQCSPYRIHLDTRISGYIMVLYFVAYLTNTAAAFSDLFKLAPRICTKPAIECPLGDTTCDSDSQ